MFMKKRFFSIILALALIVSVFPMAAYAEETTDEDTVEVYLSISHDAAYLKTPEDEIMAFKKMNVPYFDLALYGLQKYYFVSETYGKGENTEEDENGNISKPSSDLEPGSAETAAGKVTMLHAFIYATEVYYCGINPGDAGKGYLNNEGLIGSNVFSPEGSTGSMYLRQIWGMDENLNYYHNYKYPLASEGWGSTADQILLHDGDIVTVGHFTDWSFHQDPLSVFNLIKAGKDTVITDVEQNQSIDLTVYLAGKGGNYTTAHTPRTEGLAVYYTALSDLDTGVVTQWSFLGNADENGNITVKARMEPGEYLVCVAGQHGETLPNDIVSTPGGIILNVTKPKEDIPEEKPEELLLGDVNGDGKVNGKDSILLLQHLTGQTADAFNQTNADYNADGKVNGKDSILLLQYLTN